MSAAYYAAADELEAALAELRDAQHRVWYARRMLERQSRPAPEPAPQDDAGCHQVVATGLELLQTV